MLTPLPATVQRDGHRYAGTMLPLIGISTYVADVAWASWERRAAVLPASYFELVAAAAVTLGTIASIWWFALKPRRKAKAIAKSDAQGAAGGAGEATTEQL
jgi:hypothetical protein